MNRKRFLNGKSTEKKYRWSLFIIVCVVDFVLTLALFFLYVSMQVAAASASSTSQLGQACVSTDILYESLEAVVNQIRADPDTSTFLNASGTDRLQEATVGIKIRTLRTANPYFRYVTLYNSANQRFVSSAAAGYAETLDADFLYRQLGDRSSVCIFRSIGVHNNISPVKNATVYTFIFPIRDLSIGAKDLVIIDVNDSYFDKAFAPICVEDQSHQIFLQNSTGNVIATMDSPAGKKYFDTSAGDDALALEAPANSPGFLFRQGSAGLEFVTFSEAAYAGWIIFSVLPFSTLFSRMGTLIVLTLVFSAITLVLGYVLSFRVGTSLYEPIKVLYENYVTQESRKKKGNELELLSKAISDIYSKADRLEQGLITSYQETKNTYLRYLFTGAKQKVSAALPAYQRLEIDLEAPGYGIVLLECQPQQPQALEEQGRRDGDLFIKYYALENITRELVSAVCSLEFFRMDQERFALLLYLQSDSLPEGLRQSLEKVSQTMQREFRLDTTICVGNIVSAWQDINLAYEQVLIALHSKPAGYYGKVFLSRDTPDVISTKLYFNGLHERLAKLVRKEDIEGCAAEFDLALMAMDTVSFSAARTYFRHVLMSVLDDFSIALERDSVYFGKLMEHLYAIDHCHNVQSLKTVALEFLSSLSLRLSANRKNSNQDAAMQAKSYIDQNYADPDLSLRALAEKVSLSPAYLGKVFTTVTTYTFNDYLNHVRTSKAASLLLSTKLPISQISRQVGILNTNYFYSVFKKQYGLTPNSYRQQRPDEAGNEAGDSQDGTSFNADGDRDSSG